MKVIRTVALVFAIAFLQSNASEKYVISHWGGGMGICLTSMLNHLAYCEKTNKIPVIYWRGSAYSNPQGFNGSNNEWEYYFKPVSNLYYESGDKRNSFCQSSDCESFNYYNTSQSKRESAHKLMSKYIHPNAIVQAKIDSFFNSKMANKKTIGIHLRGTDKYTEDKPVAPSIAIREALKYADEDAQFFILTDDKKLFNEMLILLAGKKVIYYDCYRSDNGKPLHLRYKPAFCQLGEDVVVEMWLMSKCNILIHTLSNVSSIPLYINPSLEHVLLVAQ